MKETIGLIGRKCGMTRIFKEDGTGVPVSVVEVTPNRITQLKSADGKDGYNAVQLTYGSVKPQRINKPAAGFFTKVNVEAGRGLQEFRVNADSLGKYAVGQALSVEIFSEGQKVDVVGTTKGKGFAGVLKKYHFAAQDATHGNSLSHRAPGSIGQRQSPGRVFKGKKMCGHMGDEKSTMHNLEVVKVIADKNLLLIKGAIPGAPGSDVMVRPAIKKG
jgi:large subunit ribosomal protein L3